MTRRPRHPSYRDLEAALDERCPRCGEHFPTLVDADGRHCLGLMPDKSPCGHSETREAAMIPPRQETP